MRKSVTLDIWMMALKMVLLIAVVEFFIMLLLQKMPLPELSGVELALVDALLLGVISAPLIYLLFVAPARKSLSDSTADYAEEVSGNPVDASEPKPALLHQLEAAVEAGDFELFYQPQIDLESEAVCGVEALIRWNGPDGHMPGEFIPIAEKQGLIHEVSSWVMRQALVQQQSWQAEGMDLKVAVNLSNRDLADDTIIDVLQRLCRDSGVSPSVIRLELNASLFEGTIEMVMRRIRALSDAGFELSLDDYTGEQEIFGLLGSCNLVEVKIDPARVVRVCDSLESEQEMRTLIDQAHDHGICCVAVGAESFDVVERLRMLKCDVVQGYHFSKPLTAEAFADWYREQREQ